MSTLLRGRARVALEFAATAGGSGGFTTYFPEGPIPGNRSLTTIVVGLEATGSESGRGPFASVGLGIGHSTLSGARGSARDFPNNAIPARNETLPVLGAGIGYRTMAGPGPFGLQFALRAHAAVRAGETPTGGSALTVGMAY